MKTLLLAGLFAGLFHHDAPKPAPAPVPKAPAHAVVSAADQKATLAHIRRLVTQLRDQLKAALASQKATATDLVSAQADTKKIQGILDQRNAFIKRQAATIQKVEAAEKKAAHDKALYKFPIVLAIAVIAALLLQHFGLGLITALLPPPYNALSWLVPYLFGGIVFAAAYLLLP